MKPRLSEDSKNAIVRAVNSGMKQTDIANLFGISQPAISQTVSNFRARGTVKTQQRSGRPRKTSEKTDRWIVRQAKIDPKQTSTSINRELGESKGIFIRASQLLDQNFQAFQSMTQLFAAVYEKEVFSVVWQ